MITKTCLECKRTYTPDLAKDASVSLEAWQRGTPIQDAFPNATNEQREQLQTGLCSDACFDKFLSPDSESDPREVDSAIKSQIDHLNKGIR